ncbi:hypothetical protein E8E12_001094 [Didymella heteroderae]|uniref:Uncharacterized protein n=1 Tax=Didymella heteroderae TaxID=1769908 RepID=A0A9P5BWE1_9PLEO|nr:hypothetical protein E8E12_001094 [Didymella heteroderae]
MSRHRLAFLDIHQTYDPITTMLNTTVNMPTLRKDTERTYDTAPGFRTPFGKRDGNNEFNHILPSRPLACSVANQSDFSSQPLSPQASSSNSEPEIGSDNNEDDTEEEDNTELEQYYLARTSDKGKDVNTIFGKGVRVWKSLEGTVYTYIIGENIDGEVVMPRKRKCAQRFAVSSLQADEDQTSNQRLAPVTPPSRPAPTPAPVTKLRARNPAKVSTIFHHGSAAIKPRGACTRPPQHVRQRLQAVPVSSPLEKRRRLMSGSFGTFAGAPSRFSSRSYRLLPGRKDDEEGYEQMVFRARPWSGK